MNAIINDSRRAGQLAADRVLFGENSRYAIFPVHTRFSKVCWFVTDAEKPDPETGRPAIIRQSDYHGEAVDGLAEAGHVHKAGTVLGLNIDTCAACGRDIRHHA